MLYIIQNEKATICALKSADLNFYHVKYTQIQGLNSDDGRGLGYY